MAPKYMNGPKKNTKPRDWGDDDYDEDMDYDQDGDWESNDEDWDEKDI